MTTPAVPATENVYLPKVAVLDRVVSEIAEAVSYTHLTLPTILRV